ncbi:MAG: WYL domain-containing protein [Oscillospiraceae bacterium]|nr:WYL domain-containing protein [Oscillospiraceae bacterium]
MEAGIHQKLKFLYLARLFERETDEEHILTVYDILSRLEQLGIKESRKTLLEDISLLCDFGMDIITVSVGKKLGYYLGSRSFELAEIKLLADAVSSARFITEKKSRQLLSKLEGLTSIFHGREIHRRIYVANRIKSENELIYINIDLIQQAIDKKKQITFRYFDRTVGMKKKYRQGGRSCSPFALAWNDGSYYLVGKQKKYTTLSNFRIDRMEKVELLPEAAEPVPEGFDLAEYTATTFSMFSGEPRTVTLCLDNSLANVAADRFGTDVMLIPNGEDKFTLNVKVVAAPAFYSWVFQFGDKAEIIAPQSMREEYIRMMDGIRKKYIKENT